MAQRDYEEQPEAPDLGASVQLETSQDLVGPPSGAQPLDAGYVPPDRPYALDEHGTTGQEMADGESMDARLAREVPDDQPADPDRAGRITIADQGAALETPDDMAAVDVGIDGGAASAEEAAVHLSDDPVAPVEVEPSVADAPELDDPEVEAALADDPLAERAQREAAGDALAGGDDLAGGIDGRSDASGAASSASGRDDVGPV
jgi:uncharacterized protein DUF5709